MKRFKKTIGCASYHRLTQSINDNKPVVVVMEYENIVFDVEKKTLNSPVIDIFFRLESLRIPVYLLAQECASTVLARIVPFGYKQFPAPFLSGVIPCLNDEAKETAVSYVKATHPEAMIMCWGTHFTAHITCLDKDDLCFYVYDACQPSSSQRYYAVNFSVMFEIFDMMFIKTDQQQELQSRVSQLLSWFPSITSQGV